MYIRWGSYGQLGHGDTVTQLLPQRVQTLQGHRVVRICCGFRHTVVTTIHTSQSSVESGENLEDVWSWG